MLQHAQDSATFFQLAASYPDFFLQLSLLLHDPLYHDAQQHQTGKEKPFCLFRDFSQETGRFGLWPDGCSVLAIVLIFLA